MNEQTFLEGRSQLFAHGGYPRFLVMKDGAPLCMHCAKMETPVILRAMAYHDTIEWEPEVFDINWEDENLYCSHCSDSIPSAYGE
jgi:hypothetical protein